jgi:hypothetical protein
VPAAPSAWSSTFSTDGNRSFTELVVYPPGFPDVPATALPLGPLGAYTVRPVHRDEVITDATHGPQPVPLETVVHHYTHELEAPTTAIGRLWAPKDHRRCRLCRVCTASPRSDGKAYCFFGVPGIISEEDAPLCRKE